MKKQYETPNARKVEFDYSENVVASDTPSKEAGCPNCQKQTQVKSRWFWFTCWEKGF